MNISAEKVYDKRKSFLIANKFVFNSPSVSKSRLDREHLRNTTKTPEMMIMSQPKKVQMPQQILWQPSKIDSD